MTSAEPSAAADRPPARGRRLRRALLALLLSTVGLLIVGELGLRLAGYGGTPARWYDAKVGWRFLPRQKRQMFSHTGEPLAWMEINDLGFRGPAPKAGPPPAGTTRVACLGDSFTHGWGVEDEHTYPRALARLLEEEGERTEVANFGMPGHNLWNAERLYRETVRDHEPDVCLLGIYLNDAQPEAGGPKHTDALVLRMLGRTALVEAFHRHVRRRFRLFDAGRTPELKAKLSHYHENWHEIENDAGSPVALPYWEEALLSLAQLSEDCARDEAELAVLLFPSHEQWDEIRRAPEADRAAAREEWSGTQRFLAERLDALGVPHVDLLDAFLAAEEDPFGVLDQGHPSDLGYRIAAEEAARLLRERAWLAPGD